MKYNWKAIALSVLIGIAGAVVLAGGRSSTVTGAWTVTLDNLTPGKNDTTDAFNGVKLIEFVELEDYTSMSGYVYVEAFRLDTGDAAADVVDTTKDSMIVLIYTDWNGAVARLIRTDSVILGGGGEDTIFFDLANDTVGDRIYMEFITAIADSADGSTIKPKVHYRATAGLIQRQ